MESTSPNGKGGGNARRSPGVAMERQQEPFHVLHKVPAGDSPYVRAKHLQVVEKDYDAAIVWFWKAINAGDRVESALKDMAVVMKQQDRAEEAIEAIMSFRHLLPRTSQESINNLLIDLYKKCGRLHEQAELLKNKLRKIYLGETFGGKPTKTARSHGKKFQVTIQQERSRILGNLGWVYMQQLKYVSSEAVFRKAQMIDPDANKACNLGLVLLRQGRLDDARLVLEEVRMRILPGSDNPRTTDRAEELLKEIESQSGGDCLETEITERMEMLMKEWTAAADSSAVDVVNTRHDVVSRSGDDDGKPFDRTRDQTKSMRVKPRFEDDVAKRMEACMKGWSAPFQAPQSVPVFGGISAMQGNKW